MAFEGRNDCQAKRLINIKLKHFYTQYEINIESSCSLYSNIKEDDQKTLEGSQKQLCKSALVYKFNNCYFCCADFEFLEL